MGSTMSSAEDLPLTDRLSSLRERTRHYFEQSVSVVSPPNRHFLQDYWQELSEPLKEEGGAIAIQLAALAQVIGPAIRRSPLLTEADEREAGHAFKGMRAALRFRNFKHWGTELLHDEGTVLGVQAAGESDEYKLHPAEARRVFDQWADSLQSRLELMNPQPANTPDVPLATPTPEGWWQRIKSSINLRPSIFGFSIDLKKLFSKKKHVLSNAVAEIASPPVPQAQPPITTFVQDGTRIDAHLATITNASQTTIIRPGYIEVRGVPITSPPPPSTSDSVGTILGEKIKQNLSGPERNETRAKRMRLWKLREEGVQLRNEVPTDHKEWYQRFENWHVRLLEAADDLDPELKSWLYPLNTVKDWNLGMPVNQAHVRQLDWISELLNRLENYLNKTRPS